MGKLTRAMLPQRFRNLPIFNLLRFGLWAMLLLLAGCFPAPLGKYYKPSMATISAHYSGDECHGMAGAPAVMEVSLAPGIQARIDAMRLHGAEKSSGRVMHIVIGLPLGTTIQFTGAAAKVRENKQGAWRDIPLKAVVTAAVRTGPRVRMADIAPSPVQAIDAHDFHASATLYYSLPDYVPEQFTMTLPAIEITGGGTIAPARFEAHAQQRKESYPGEYRDYRSLIYTTVESHAILEEQLARCRAMVPAGTEQERCKYLLSFDEGGFVRTLAPFVLSGRWYVFKVGPGKPFNGELRLKYTRPLDWGFKEDRLLLQDEHGQDRAISFNSMAVYMFYAVPPDTLLHGVNSSASKTELSLDMELGTSEAGSYQVQLPAMRVNGRLYDLPTINLEKHLFDIGIEPFNC